MSNFRESEYLLRAVAFTVQCWLLLRYEKSTRFNAIIPNKVSIKVMYHLYHHQLQIALFNGLHSLALALFSLLHCFSPVQHSSGALVSQRAPNIILNRVWRWKKITQHWKYYVKEISERAKHWLFVFSLLLLIVACSVSRETRKKLYIFSKCIDERNRINENATIFHDKRRTNEWKYKIEKILSYGSVLCFFFFLLLLAEHSALSTLFFWCGVYDDVVDSDDMTR